MSLNDITKALSGQVPPVAASSLQPGAKPDVPDKSDAPSGIAQNAKDQVNVEQAVQDRDKFQAGGKPKFPELAPEPKEDHADDPIKGYVSAIGLIGAMSSAFARSGATNAMNAASGVLNAMQSKDAADFKSKMDIWKVKNDNAMKLFDYQNDTYKDILASKNKSVDERIAELRANAAAFKDDNMMRLLEARNPAIIEDLLAKGDLARTKMQESLDKIQDWKDKQDRIEEGLKAFKESNPNANPQQILAETTRLVNESTAAEKGTSKGTDKSTLTPEVIDQKVEALHNGATYASLGLSTRSKDNPNKDAIDEALAKKYPDFDMTKAQNENAGRRADQTAQGRRAGQAEQGAGELEQLLPATKASLKKLDLSRFSDLNALKLYAEKHTGDPDVSEAYTNLQETQNAYTALLVRGGQRTDAAQAASEHLIDLAFAPKQADRILDTMAANSARILKGIDNAREGKLNRGETSTAAPSQEDLAHTAELHGMTVEQVKQKLGIK